MNKQNLQKIFFLVSFWILAVIFVTFYDWAVLLFDPAISPPIDAKDYDVSTIFIISLSVTIIGGIFIASIEVFYFSKLLRKKPFGISLLIKIAFYTANIFFFTSIGSIATDALTLRKPIIDQVIIDNYQEYVSSPRLMSIWIFWSFMVALALFILQISEKLGQGVLVNYILGRYHHPKEESRIFMFLDLKSSTTYAERLGHIKYSKLIQDCFYDLTDVVAYRKAQIYQYVGDEAVLTWITKEGLKSENCIKTYFDFKSVLVERSAYYKKEYGLVPEFKAGLDSGSITVAEVGEIKKELAYHGDVLNTAARIQGKCNELKAELLLSERLKNQFAINQNIKFELIGNVQLKGKEEAINIYNATTFPS